MIIEVGMVARGESAAAPSPGCGTLSGAAVL